MLGTLLFILILLWFFGYIHVSFFAIPNPILFHINGYGFGLWNILMLIVICWVIGILPFPFRAIAGVLLVLWILSTLGIVAFGGLSSLLVLIFIFGLIFFLIGG